MHRSIKILDITSTATSEPISIEGAEIVTIWATATIGIEGHAAVIKVQTSSDGTNWANYNKLISNVVNSNVQQLTRVSSLSFTSGDGADYASMSPEDTFRWIRLTGGGSHTIAYVEIEDKQGH